MRVCVHGNADVRMAHQVLQCFRVHTSPGHIAAVGMAADMRRDIRDLNPIDFVVAANHMVEAVPPSA